VKTFLSQQQLATWKSGSFVSTSNGKCWGYGCALSPLQQCLH